MLALAGLGAPLDYGDFRDRLRLASLGGSFAAGKECECCLL